jgi:hypothetical protein
MISLRRSFSLRSFSSSVNLFCLQDEASKPFST